MGRSVVTRISTRSRSTERLAPHRAASHFKNGPRRPNSALTRPPHAPHASRSASRRTRSSPSVSGSRAGRPLRLVVAGADPGNFSISSSASAVSRCSIWCGRKMSASAGPDPEWYRSTSSDREGTSQARTRSSIGQCALLRGSRALTRGPACATRSAVTGKQVPPNVVAIDTTRPGAGLIGSILAGPVGLSALRFTATSPRTGRRVAGRRSQAFVAGQTHMRSSAARHRSSKQQKPDGPSRIDPSC